MSAPSAGPPHTATRNRRPLIIAALVVGVLVIAVAAVVAVGRASNQAQTTDIDWSTLPQTLNCASIPKDPRYPLPADIDSVAPDPVRTQTVRLEHAGGDRLEVALTMAGPPPPIPNLLSIPGYDDYYPVPGSLNFSAALFFGGSADRSGSYTLSFSRSLYGTGDKQWTVEGYTTDLDDTSSVGPRVVDSQVAGNTITFTTNLSDFPQLSGEWTTPTAQVNPVEFGYPSADPDNPSFRSPQEQRCSTATAAASSPSATPPSSAAATTTPRQKMNESQESESGDLFAGEPVSPGACAEGGICELSAPSGNYYCTISRTGAFCSPPLGESLSTGVDSRLITVGSDGETGLLPDSGGNSHLEDRQSMSDTTFPYGSTMTAYGMTCAFQGSTGGASCRHDASGHGFSVNPASYRFF